MTQNLKLGSNQSIQLAPSNSNLSTAFELPSINSLDGWGSDNNSHYLYIDNNLGGYYSWTTVTAKTTVMNEMSYNSICPKGWHLPTSYEWMALKNSYPAEDLFKSPPNLSLSGKIYNRQISEQNQRGYYWTASEGRPDYPLYIQFYDILNNNQEYFGANMSYTNKYEGYSVRCIAGDSSVENYSIQYSSNGGSPSSIKTTTGSAPLSAYVDLNEAEPQRSGYIFWGWCTTNPGLGEECSGKRYRKIYPLADGTNVKLYAMWHTPCNSTGATMKDGKCWNTVDSKPNRISRLNRCI